MSLSDSIKSKLKIPSTASPLDGAIRFNYEQQEIEIYFNKEWFTISNGPSLAQEECKQVIKQLQAQLEVRRRQKAMREEIARFTDILD